jgi:16S rRNA (cytosine1402-N4)-methyltransferase
MIGSLPRFSERLPLLGQATGCSGAALELAGTGSLDEAPLPKEYHRPVLLNAVVELLAVHDGGSYFDGTLGGGGHAEAILSASAPSGRLYGIDRDPEALAAARSRLARFGRRFVSELGAFDEIARIASLNGVSFDGALLDLGLSSHQIDAPERGFAYDAPPETPLDMRMSREGPTAADLLNELTVDELAGIFRRYGEDPFAGPVARAVAAGRLVRPVTTVGQMKAILRSAVPAHFTPVKVYARAFQALRVAVNDELNRLERGLDAVFARLLPGGRLAVLSYHSLEDRLVKDFFRQLVDPCICPPGLPVCACGRAPAGKLETRGALKASGAEIAENPRARSVRLRVVSKEPGRSTPDRPR